MKATLASIYMGIKENKVRKISHVITQSWPAATKIMANGFGLHGLALTISCTRKTPNWELVPQERGRVTKGSASHSTFRDSMNQ